MINIADLRGFVFRLAQIPYNGLVPLVDLIAPDYSINEGMPGGYGVSESNAMGQPRWYSINICLDDQLEEGKRLFNDANYKVMAPVDVAKFEATMDKLGANRTFEWRLSDTSLNLIFGIVILGIVLLILRAVLTTS
jgi:hypothetical protein